MAEVVTVAYGVKLLDPHPRTAPPWSPPGDALHGFLDVIRQGHPTTPIVVHEPRAAAPTPST
jgi:hypothetical protein